MQTVWRQMHRQEHHEKTQLACSPIKAENRSGAEPQGWADDHAKDQAINCPHIWSHKYTRCESKGKDLKTMGKHVETQLNPRPFQQ